MTDNQEIEVEAFIVEHTTITTTRADFDRAHAAGDLDNEYDAWLSDMSRTTVIVAPDGTVINPYGQVTDLMVLLKPLLDEIPSWRIEQYATGRRMEEE